jgi:hypothetical protein
MQNSELRATTRIRRRRATNVGNSSSGSSDTMPSARNTAQAQTPTMARSNNGIGRGFC